MSKNHKITNRKLVNNFFSYILSLSFFLASCAVSTKGNGQAYYNNGLYKIDAGRCYAINHLLYEGKYPVYTGDTTNANANGLTYLLHIETGQSTTRWEKRKEDTNCLSVNPDDCFVWCNIEVLLTKAIRIVKDTTYTKDFVLQSFAEKKHYEKNETEWIEIICDEKITPSLVMKIQEKLKWNKLYKGELNGNIDEDTKQAVSAFQRMNKLPVGPLNIESLDVLGIAY